MTRSREEFAHFAETVTGSSSRLAWLLTGDVTRAKGLVRAALARTYVDWPHLHDDFARGQRTREVLLRNAIHDPEPFVPLATDRLARLGQLSPRDRAIAVLRHGFELPEAAVAELVGCSRGAVRTVAHDTHDLRGGLRDADAPPELGRLDPAEAVAEGERLRTTSSRRDRRLVLGGLAAVALLAAVVVPQVAGPPEVRTESLILDARLAETGRPPQGTFGLGRVTDGDGQAASLVATVVGSGPGRQLVLALDYVDGAARIGSTVLDLPTQQGRVSQGMIGRMPVYVVRGRVAQAMVSFGPTVGDASRRSVEALPLSEWTVLWPWQPGLSRTSRQPVGLLWNDGDQGYYAAAVAGSYPAAQRMRVLAPNGRQGLLTSDGTSLLFETWSGESRLALDNGPSLVAVDRVGIGYGMPFTAVGSGPATRGEVLGVAGARVRLQRATPPTDVYAVTVEGPGGTQLAESVLVQVFDGAKPVARVQVGPATR